MKAFVIQWVDEEVLRKIHAVRSARLTGSFARGVPRNESDLDFRMKRDDVSVFAKWLKETGRAFDSEIKGHVTVDGIEIYSDFHKLKRSEREDVVKINGCQFKTW